MDGSLEIPATRLIEVAVARGWSEGRARNAMRVIDGGMGERFGYKSFEETTVSEGGDDVEGMAWVYHLYDERVEELEELV